LRVNVPVAPELDGRVGRPPGRSRAVRVPPGGEARPVTHDSRGQLPLLLGAEGEPALLGVEDEGQLGRVEGTQVVEHAEEAPGRVGELVRLPRGVHLGPNDLVSSCNQTDSTLSCECKKGTPGACELLRETDPDSAARISRASNSAPKIDPDKPASEVLRGKAKREFPGEHLDKPLNQINELLKSAEGEANRSLQKAKKSLEQQDRILDD
jgi:hypothetical protein